MSKQKYFILGLLCLVGLGVYWQNVAFKHPESQSFRFTYKTMVWDIPVMAKEIKVWIPIPQSNLDQRISNIEVEAPISASAHIEKEYQNHLMYFTATGPNIPSPLEIKISFNAERKITQSNKFDKFKVLPRFLAADRLVPLTPSLQSLGDSISSTSLGTMGKSKEIFAYILSHMTYNKTEPGWGRGDAVRACDVGKGNCTDYHSLFNALTRSVNIPSRFVIGFPVPMGQIGGDILGYHCWAEFFDKKKGWIPVDISEADKATKRPYRYFGSVPPDRIAFSQGRDILLDPPQLGGRLNYFIYPYVELDGEPISTLENHFSFERI